jgi:hypothetical protein
VVATGNFPHEQSVFTTTRPATGLLFRNDFAPHIRNYHHAPQRRWVITLAGSVDIELGDGTRETFLPGDVYTLVKDISRCLTIGSGHTLMFECSA